MGFFDVFTNRDDEDERVIKPNAAVRSKMAVPKEAFPAAGTDGWDAIIKEFERAYPGQKRPKFYKTPLRWVDGGNDPLDGICVYDGGDYWHFVGLGLSELYGKVTDDPHKSGWGMEFTFKLKKFHYENEELEFECVRGVLQSLARVTARRGEIFEPYQCIFTGQKTGIDAYQKSNLKGLITVPDSAVNTIETPNGEVEFVSFVGMTNAELSKINSEQDVREIYEMLGTDVTDYHRKSLVD